MLKMQNKYTFWKLLKENYISESDVSSADTGFDIMPNKGTRGK